MTSWKSIEDAHALPSLLLIKATTIDLEDLRDLAWASAHKPGTTRTVYWDEPRSDGSLFALRIREPRGHLPTTVLCEAYLTVLNGRKI